VSADAGTLAARKLGARSTTRKRFGGAALPQASPNRQDDGLAEIGTTKDARREIVRFHSTTIARYSLTDI
jgi:hypothetical protein